MEKVCHRFKKRAATDYTESTDYSERDFSNDSIQTKNEKIVADPHLCLSVKSVAKKTIRFLSLDFLRRCFQLVRRLH